MRKKTWQVSRSRLLRSKLAPEWSIARAAPPLTFFGDEAVQKKKNNKEKKGKS